MMMRYAALWLLLAFAATPALLAANEWRDAEVETSEGKTAAGKIMLVNDQLILHNEAQKRKYTIRLADLKQIESLVESESMEKKWFFKESGRDEKIYTGETYPLRQFNTRVTFQDGHALEGHIISTNGFLKAGDDKPSLFNLVRQMEGKVGEKLDDLVYVKKITLKAGGGVLGTISGTLRLPQGEKLVALMAIHCKNDFSIEAKLLPGNGFKFTDCTAGTYDLVAVSDQAIYAGFSGGEAGRKNAAPVLTPETRKEMADWAKNVRDFFDAHDLLYGVGDKDRAYALVRMERARDRVNTLKDDTGFRRYEVWLMEKPEEEWQIKKRFFLSRQLATGKDMPRERLVVRSELGGNLVSAETPNLTLPLDFTAPTERDARGK